MSGLVTPVIAALGQDRPFAERRPNHRFLICKRPLREVSVNGRFWPNPAIGARASRMSAVGQKRTSRALAIYVRFWGLCGHSSAATTISNTMENSFR